MRKAGYLILLLLLLAGAFLAGSRYSQRSVARHKSTAALSILYYVDPMHPAYKSDKPGIAPDCGMELVPVYSDGGSADTGESSASVSPGTVKISPDKQQLIGVRVSQVERASGSRTLRLLGRVVPDEGRLYKLSAGIDGFIQEVFAATTGSQVKKDQLLATFSAPNATSAIQTFILNAGAEQRMTKLVEESSIEGQALPAANWNVQQRTQQLQNFGVSLAQMEDIKRTHRIPDRLKIFAPADGFVLARNVAPGQKFERGAEWYRIADLHHIWIVADVFENEAQFFRPGTRARAKLPNQQQTFVVTVSDVPPVFDPATRTLKLRLEAENPGLALRPEMFVDVELPVALPSGISVPLDAVLDSGLRKTVFVERTSGVFEPRVVETGWRVGDRVQILRGLALGERVVVSGNFFVDSESRLKAAAAGTVPRTTPMQSAQATRDTEPHTAKDPTCGMTVDVQKAAASGRKSEYRGVTYYFCSDGCKRAFDQAPKPKMKNSPDTARAQSSSTGARLP